MRGRGNSKALQELQDRVVQIYYKRRNEIQIHLQNQT